MGLRFVRQSDCPALLDIYARYIETPITFEYELPSRAEFDRRLREFSGFYPYLVWEEQGDILGYAYAHRQFERAAYQWNAEITVYLRPEACGKGLGPRLHRAVLDLLRLQGIKSAYAYIIADNLPSRRMCQAMGYTLAATFPTTGYKAGALGIDVLINAVPEIKNFANVTGEQVASLDSKDMSDDVWLKLSKRVNELLAQRDVDGIVITHGTDTLEETAYFLNLTVNSKKPVVITGAMRPATAISADGPMNLLNAVRLASDPASRDRGVLVCLNDQIDSARNVTKTHTTSVDTFKSPLGPIGFMNDGHPTFYNQVDRRHAGNTEFDVRNAASLPYVKIIYSHANDDALFVDAAINAGVKGIIYAGTGNGRTLETLSCISPRSGKGAYHPYRCCVPVHPGLL